MKWRDKKMKGQRTVYDDGIENDRRPCRYRFPRYIGQKVYCYGFPDEVFTIIDIPSGYYTIIVSDKGRQFVGTPTTIWPIREGEAIC